MTCDFSFYGTEDKADEMVKRSHLPVANDRLLRWHGRQLIERLKP
jgi:hypothetical protein